ncbi:phiSA1p31-related protein [Streptomyces sp. CAU 1734]|uniref:phiSA1p31-related protein n=1 Tax=Streptomyces sp. CAU 1734 TaxID=3140360 RepID=UPI003260373A
MTGFKVGDRVQALTRRGVVTYGPVSSTFSLYTAYAVQVDGDEERLYRETDLSAALFAVGDRLKDSTGKTYEVIGGPYTARVGIPWYAVKDDAGYEMSTAALGPLEFVTEETAPTIAVGDRVRIVRAKNAESRHGYEGVVTSVKGQFRAERGDRHPFDVRLDDGDVVHCAEVEKVESRSFTHGGVTYLPDTDYRDRDGDIWRFALVDGEMWGSHSDSRYSDANPIDGWRLAYAVDNYGPLTQV